jgi:starch-binding outer membrane protein, SusD/RagB family
MSHDRKKSRAAARVAAVVLAFGALGALHACKGSELLEQEAPSRVLSNTLDDPRNAQLLVTSTIADFECALAQYIVAEGLVGDELRDAQLGAAGWDHDRRTINKVGGVYATNTCLQAQFAATYTPLATARFTADDVLKKLEKWTDAEVANRQDLIAQAAAYAGYSLVLLGEGFCSMAIDAGPELTPQQVFTEAEARFTKAIAAAPAANTSIKMMAYVGRARARLNKGDKAGAKADALQVIDPTFVKTATYSASTFRRENRVWDFLMR